MTIPNEGRDGVTKDIKILLNEADPIWTTLRHEYVEGLLINKVVYKC